jgi:uncharacterized protein YqeY
MEKKLRQLIKEAMIAKDKQKQQTYKNILESAQKAAKDKKEEVNDSYIISAVKKEIKQLNDLLQYCTEGSDKYTETTRNIEIAKTLLPETVSDDEVLKYLVDNNLDKNIGVCMKALKSNFGDKLDSKAASGVVKEYINS